MDSIQKTAKSNSPESTPTESTPGASTLSTGTDALPHKQSTIAWPDILRGLHGIATATKMPVEEASSFVQTVLTAMKAERSSSLYHKEEDSAFSLQEWYALFTTAGFEDSSRHRVHLALALAFLCNSGRQNIAVLPAELDFVWKLIYEALSDVSITYTISRSAQGFLAIPLWSIMKDGNIDELFRLHVWLADGKRGVTDLAIHAHQSFAQSWILAGEGADLTFDSQPASANTATHAEFGVSWSDSQGKESSQAYKTHQTSSTIVNTGRLVHLTSRTSDVHSRNMTYTIPSGVFHRSQVMPDVLHATIFLFDSQRGFQAVAPVLGPIDIPSYTQQREAAGMVPAMLSDAVQAVRTWDTMYHLGLEHCRRAEWEDALRALRNALHVAQSVPTFPGALHYRFAVRGEIGHVYRMMGQYELASGMLQDALRETPVCKERVQMTGELAVIYRHLNQLEDAKRACEDQYDTAKSLGLEFEECRAIGNLGMVNYQIYLHNHDTALLDLAINQLTKRVDIARKLKEIAGTKLKLTDIEKHLFASSEIWEAIALARLSLCYTSRGQLDNAIKVALEALHLTYRQQDSSKTAFSRFFYGRALLLAGRTEEALKQFNTPNTCTPVIALCREPSDEHREYIKEMISAGADLELRDEHGYSALDCVIYNGDDLTREVIEKGLQAKFFREAEAKLEQQRHEAIVRKGYRDLFQDKLRPVLISSKNKSISKQLRQVYADTLATDAEKSRLFDHLKFVRYYDFLNCGRLPQSTDGLTQQLDTGLDVEAKPVYIIFLSYRWIAKNGGVHGASPDDLFNTQYKRMLRAIEEFLMLHPNVERKDLGLWLVSLF
jgi:tetratricopeptide (TPR) repeat protein